MSRADGPSALIIGAAGQDGRLLSEHLRRRGYAVTGAVRPGGAAAAGGVALDILDAAAVSDLVAALRPREIYYLAAHHHSSTDAQGAQHDLMAHSHAVHCDGFVNVLDACVRTARDTRIFYASSALVFGAPERAPQSEATPVAPICAYGITKAAGMEIARRYREKHGLFAACGILYNHESPWRAERFVSQKIVRGAVAVREGAARELVLGDLAAVVDWGAAEDHVRAMHAMLQPAAPQDFVIGTGLAHTVDDMARVAFAALGMAHGPHVREQPDLIRRGRPGAPLIADSRLLRRATGWAPRIGFEQMVGRMAAAALLESRAALAMAS